MPKTYQSPDSEHDPERESRPKKTVGVYGRHERTAPRGAMVAIAAILALVFVFLLYRLARGAELQEAMPPIPSGIGSHHVVSTLPLHYFESFAVDAMSAGAITGNRTAVVTTI
jgi:hypothetical protein